MTDSEINDTIIENIDRFRKAGVLTVRPGYEVAGDQFTGKRAIVATVRTKLPKSELPQGEALPDEIGDLLVDVRHASAYQRLRAIDPQAAEISRVYGRPEDDEPDFPLEREVDTGKLLTDPASRTRITFANQQRTNRSGANALASHSSKPQLPYNPVGCPPLQPIKLTANVTAGVSPGCGPTILNNFVSGTQNSLKVGMYDFTSGPILKLFENGLIDDRTLQMVLDAPAINETADQTDDQTVASLDTDLGNRSSIARALTKSDPYAKVWSFPYAYHIKLIVRDGNSFWLSSGNLNNSNEPAPPPHKVTVNDRDWHVAFENIVTEGTSLVDVFRSYLDFDFKTAAANQVGPDDNVARAVQSAQTMKAHETDTTGTSFYSARTATFKPAGSPAPVANPFIQENLAMTVTPLLTPDKVGDPTDQDGPGEYLTTILNLINNATTSIRIELQYIEATNSHPGSQNTAYESLLQSLANKISTGVDVRLIVSARYATKWGDKMKEGGVNLTGNIRTYPDVHNKGFVVDSRYVVVSSQNFSPAGVFQNRDAGVLIDCTALAGYFEPIFDSDWEAGKPLNAG